ncbi:M6 family metalloprotease domain-containing protein [Nonomuraea sp. NN258]|uniref:immune inhibitor A domain-containing protein n=1 Tax=Nonomuraea antri TaxID=2730852 RepID=UPI0015696891|nr:immune inhibitor A domain-containing protein [Nonomuraea antri]NRQ32349.1 M6 family metalloprotease domain-containing protein [Nonomuraea antri]
MRTSFLAAAVALVALAAFGTPPSFATSTTSSSSAQASASSAQAPGPKETSREVAPLSPQQREQAALRRQAVEGAVTQGPAAMARGGRAVKVGHRYVELGQERKDQVFVVLAEFGDQVDNETMIDGQIKYGGQPGPRHNAIPDPRGTDDNHTLWRPDFNRSYYQQSYFSTGGNSLRDYFRLQSSGRYDLDGYVSDWVRVPYNEARYGSDRCAPEEGGICWNNWDLVRDSANAWFEAEKAKGRTTEQIRADLRRYDVWDRYDHDNDGNFDEPDGYLDHYQVVHAGIDETWGGGAQGADAVWAHRYFAYWPQRGQAGPEGNRNGGTQIGDTGIWVGDYLTVGENSGVGLTAHEYGHDLGLPDLYAGSGENAVNYWSLMSSGSYLSTRRGPLGEYGGDLDAWSKLQLGWLNYERARAATSSTHTLGVGSYNTRDPQALLVDLPAREISTPLGKPYGGAWQWWSGKGDNLEQTLTRQIDLTGLTQATLKARAAYAIEQDYDFLYAEVSRDNATWTPLGQPLTGASDWREIGYDLTPYAGGKIWFRFRYSTDSNTTESGFRLDDVEVPGVFADDVEQGEGEWTAVGFTRSGEVGVQRFLRAYLAENRRYTGYNAFLRTGPYNFGWTGSQRIEHYPYQQGVLIWLWDAWYGDNTTRDHPGEGMILPVDARPEPLRWTSGALVRGRQQVFDAPFGGERTDRLRLHSEGVPTVFPARPGVRVFDDRNGVYWHPDLPELGVKVPDTGTRISVLRDGDRATVRVSGS